MRAKLRPKKHLPALLFQQIGSHLFYFALSLSRNRQSVEGVSLKLFLVPLKLGNARFHV